MCKLGVVTVLRENFEEIRDSYLQSKSLHNNCWNELYIYFTEHTVVVSFD